MRRRDFLRGLPLVSGVVLLKAAEIDQKPKPAPGRSVRGKLITSPDGKPALETADHKIVYLEGDEPTRGVLKDKRLAGMDFEAIGHFTSPDHFQIDPIHEAAMFIHKGGKRYFITYWCGTCYIRTYTPGPCWCCQKYTDLDLRETDDR